MPILNAHNSHHWYFPRITVDASRNMRILFGIRVLRELATKFSLFFLPVFLFQLGLKAHAFANWGLTPFQGGAILLALFSIFDSVAALVLAIPAGDFIRRYGYSAGLILSHLLYAVALISLRFSIGNLHWLWLAAIADGVNGVLMWGTFNTLFVKGAHKARMGEDLGVVQALLNVIWMVAPALSGVVILLIGYEFLFSAGLVMVGLAIVLAAFLNIPHERDDISLHELMLWLKDRRFVKLSLSIAGKTVYDVSIFVWPLYVFILLGNTEKVGLVYGIGFLLSIVASLFIGQKLDHDERRRPFAISGGFLSVLWAIRSQVFDFWSLALIDAFDKITGNYHWLFFDRVLLNRGKGRQAFSYFMYREIIINVTVAIFWVLFALMFLIAKIEWRGLFVMASVGVLMSLLINNRQEKA